MLGPSGWATSLEAQNQRMRLSEEGVPVQTAPQLRSITKLHLQALSTACPAIINTFTGGRVSASVQDLVARALIWAL